jgi:hypothetical protein
MSTSQSTWVSVAFRLRDEASPGPPVHEVIRSDLICLSSFHPNSCCRPLEGRVLPLGEVSSQRPCSFAYISGLVTRSFASPSLCASHPACPFIPIPPCDPICSMTVSRDLLYPRVPSFISPPETVTLPFAGTSLMPACWISTTPRGAKSNWNEQNAIRTVASS